MTVQTKIKGDGKAKAPASSKTTPEPAAKSKATAKPKRPPVRKVTPTEVVKLMEKLEKTIERLETQHEDAAAKKKALTDKIAQSLAELRRLARGTEDTLFAQPNDAKPTDATNDKAPTTGKDAWRTEPIGLLKLPTRIVNILARVNVTTIGHVWMRGKSMKGDYSQIEGIGQDAQDKIIIAMQKYMKANEIDGKGWPA